MANGEVHAWNILDRQPILAEWDSGIFTDFTPTDEPPAQNRWIGPPLVDLQINGYAGVDFQQDDLTAEQLLHATSALGQAGCGRFFFTLITADWKSMMQRLDKAKQLRDADPYGQDDTGQTIPPHGQIENLRIFGGRSPDDTVIGVIQRQFLNKAAEDPVGILVFAVDIRRHAAADGDLGMTWLDRNVKSPGRQKFKQLAQGYAGFDLNPATVGIERKNPVEGRRFDTHCVWRKTCRDIGNPGATRHDSVPLDSFDKTTKPVRPVEFIFTRCEAIQAGV